MNEHKITVSELIEYLKTLPSDYHVTFDNRDIDLEDSIDVIDRWKEVDFR